MSDRKNTRRPVRAVHTTKQPKRFGIKMQKKLVVLYLFVLLAFAGLSVRLLWIQRANGAKYSKQILSQRHYDSTTLPFRRGDIVDAKGNKLAVSETVYNLVIDVKNIREYEQKDKKEYLDPTMKALADSFGLDKSALIKYAVEHENTAYYVPLKKIPHDQKAAFEELASAKDSMIRGIWFEKEYIRKYPLNTLACDVIGFTSSDNVGASGLEAYYNDVLNGTTGREFGYLNDDATLERTVKPAVDGYTIHTTIDANIQAVVEKYLYQFNEEHKDGVHPGNGAENVGCIIMKVDNGEILAMASYPNFDLNNTRDTSRLIGNVMVDSNGKKTKQYITEESLATMDDATLYANLNYLWKNFCISDTYEPGSTAKAFTTAMGLETGALTGEEVFNCRGNLEIGGYTIRCHNRYGDGSVTVEDGIAWSCNVALMEEARKVGITNFSKFQQIFNLGLKTNIDIEGEARTASLIKQGKDMNPTDLAVYSFGQGFNVTMIQMIAAYSSLVNGGYYYEPHLVSKITNASGATVKNIEPRVLRQTVSETTSDKIIQYCTAVVMRQGDTRITGRSARPAGYAIGGKTGTAQTIDPETGTRSYKDYVVSFMGFAPADDPQIAIYVVVDRANATRQDDAKYATGIVRNVLTEVLPYLNIFMTEELSEKEIKELEERQLAITNMYTQTPEGDDLAGQENQQPEKPQGERPAWMDFPIDPSTGYRVDPNTRELLDPDTGDPIKEGQPALPY